MKRIQGWGNIKIGYPVPEPAQKYLAQTIGAPLSLTNIGVVGWLQFSGH